MNEKTNEAMYTALRNRGFTILEIRSFNPNQVNIDMSFIETETNEEAIYNYKQKIIALQGDQTFNLRNLHHVMSQELDITIENSSLLLKAYTLKLEVLKTIIDKEDNRYIKYLPISYFTRIPRDTEHRIIALALLEAKSAKEVTKLIKSSITQTK